MELSNYFEEFLREIRLTKSMREDLMTGHKTLRERLKNDDKLKSIIVDIFLQGSYRRSTAHRPKGDKRADVDIVVVTKLKRSEFPDPEKAMNLFIPFLNKYYKNKYKKQGRSFCIELSYVDMDLVIASAPSEEEEKVYKSTAITTLETIEEANNWNLTDSWPSKIQSITNEMLEKSFNKEKEWQTQPLWIPDRDIKEWQETHPIEQIKWTVKKNKSCNKHFVNIVKAIKWWEVINHEGIKPKSYPLEHLIGDCCPDNITSVAQGVTEVFEKIVSDYSYYVLTKTKPFLPDRGLPTHDVFARVSVEQFSEFWGYVSKAAKIAREALDLKDETDSANKWRELFGNKFPEPKEKGNNENNSKRLLEISAPTYFGSNPKKPWSINR